MVLAVGLGNPGKRYAATRHNLGFQVIDALAKMFEMGRWENRFHARVAKGAKEGRRFLLVKPQTFMNDSGRAVQEVVRFYKVPLESLLVIVDDLDLEVGKIRLRQEGSDGGHRGLRSIIECTGSQAFKRIRIGVGRPPPGESPVGRVLGPAREPAEAEKLEAAVAQAARLAADYIVTEIFENWSSP